MITAQPSRPRWPQPDAPSRRRTAGQKAVISTNLIMILACCGLALFLSYGYLKVASINRVEVDSLTPLAAAEPGQRQFNVLLVGSDSASSLDEDDPIQIGRRGEHFGDVIIIAHIDERSGDIALLSIPRDLWVPIAGTGREAKINKAFETGGPTTLIETIESSFGIPIHHYINVDFAGFRGVVSTVDTVEVFFETPARDWNIAARPKPRSQTGFEVSEAGCIALDAEQSLAYVRSRYYQTQNSEGEWVTDPTADLGRIKRQQDFLRRLSKKAIQEGARNPLVLREMIEASLPHLSIDQGLTVETLLDTSVAFRSFEPEQLQTYSFPAVDSRVGNSQVLLPVESKLEPIVELFNGANFDSPDTIDVTVASNAQTSASEQTLAGVGFEVGRKQLTGTYDTPIIEHGPDGLAAAEIVAGYLPDSYQFEQSASIYGRAVVVHEHPTVSGLTAQVVEPNPVVAAASVATEGVAVDAPGGC